MKNGKEQINSMIDGLIIVVCLTTILGLLYYVGGIMLDNVENKDNE